MNIDYGQCFHCNRIMPTEYLTQIRLHSGHLIKGKFHHKTICKSCKTAADEIFEEG